MLFKVKNPSRLTVWIGLGMTVVFSVLRILLLGADIDPHTDAYRVSYWLIALMVLSVAVIVFLLWKRKEKCCALPADRFAAPAVWTVVTGAVISVVTGTECFRYLGTGVAPAPLAEVQNGVDRFCLIGGFLCGIAGGVVLAVEGVFLLKSRSTGKKMQLLLLLPTLWVWFRLARYELSYISAMSVAQTFYDYLMMVSLLLFTFFFARYLAGVGMPSCRVLLTVSLCAGAFSVSNVATRIFTWLAGDSNAFAISRLAGFPDMALGILALLAAFALRNGEGGGSWIEQRLHEK